MVRYSEDELLEEAVDHLRLLGFTFATKHGGGDVTAKAMQCEVVASVVSTSTSPTLLFAAVTVSTAGGNILVRCFRECYYFFHL